MSALSGSTHFGLLRGPSKGTALASTDLRRGSSRDRSAEDYDACYVLLSIHIRFPDHSCSLIHMSVWLLRPQRWHNWHLALDHIIRLFLVVPTTTPAYLCRVLRVGNSDRRGGATQRKPFETQREQDAGDSHSQGSLVTDRVERGVFCRVEDNCTRQGSDPICHDAAQGKY
jgi:hypothetical protein